MKICINFLKSPILPLALSTLGVIAYLRYKNYYSNPPNLKEISNNDLKEAFEVFIKNIDENSEPTGSFYKDWLRIGEIVFTPEQVLELANKSAYHRYCVQCVLLFMGYKLTNNLAEDLKKIQEEKREMLFDSELFCEQLFKSIDTDNSGFIDLNELIVMMQDMNLFDDQTPREQQAKELFAQMDTNRNGKIELEEFQKWWYQQEDKLKR